MQINNDMQNICEDKEHKHGIIIDKEPSNKYKQINK